VDEDVGAVDVGVVDVGAVDVGAVDVDAVVAIARDKYGATDLLWVWLSQIDSAR
jgi:hypothetical protein